MAITHIANTTPTIGKIDVLIALVDKPFEGSGYENTSNELL